MVNERKSKQTWKAGDIVNVGFVKGLMVIACTAVRDGMPDIYTLQQMGTGRVYEFIPHNGLTRIS